MSARRVGISGLGVIVPGAVGAEAMFANLLARGRFVKPIEAFDPSSFPCRIAGQLDGFSARKYVPRSYRKAVKVMARDIEIAVAAADLAVRDAGVVTAGIEGAEPDVEPARLACNIGAGLICADLNELGAAVNTAVRDGRFKLVEYFVDGRNTTQLFDLVEDPWEQRNVASDTAYAAEVNRLRAELSAWQREVSDPLLSQ